MNELRVEDLKSGDIILYHGFSWLSRAIRLFDGTDYNHASIYVEDKNVLEAIGAGVVKRSVDVSINPYDPVVVLRLRERPHDMSFVKQKALEYEGNRYGYEQLLLLALICCTRNVRLNNMAARFFRKVLEKASSILLDLTSGNQKALICSELVYRSYDEVISSSTDPYTIVINRQISTEEKAFKSFQIINSQPGSLISRIYGVNSNASFYKSIHTPFFQKINLEKFAIDEPSDEELESAFKETELSYINENYELNDEETGKLKHSLDKFITVAEFEGTNKIVNSYNYINYPLERFLSENGNFITPGDLYARTENLQFIGHLK